MSDTPGRSDPVGRGSSEKSGIAHSAEKNATKPRHLWRRIAVLSVVTALVAVGAMVATGFAVAHNAFSNIRRIHVAHLDAAVRPAGGPSASGQTVLITSNGTSGGPGGNASPVPSRTGLIMLLHINADQRAGGVVSIPPTTVVRIPGHGRQQISDAVIYGGASLLVETVENVTHVPIAHYARIDFPHVADVIDTIGGVKVATTSGIQHLAGTPAIVWTRDPALTENQRVTRQSALIRAVLRKIADGHLLTNPVTMVRLLNSITSMLTVDSNFTDAQLASLARELGGMSSGKSPFISAPTHVVLGRQLFTQPDANQLWAAIRQDALAAYARAHPETLTPEVVSLSSAERLLRGPGGR